MLKFRSIFFLIVSISYSSQALACPLFDDSYIDFNCNQELKYVVTGDSFVKGVGDKRDRGGYVKRVRRKLPEGATIENLGVSGITSKRLFQQFKRNLSKAREGTTKRKSRNADLIVIHVGHNDYWEGNEPSQVVNYIRRLVKYLRQSIGTEVQSEPFIVVTTLTPNLRSFQRPFIEEVNRLLLKLRSRSLPVFLRFDRLDPSGISEDGLHPTPAGYTKLGKILNRFLNHQAQNRMSKQRPDTDEDGIYDHFEENRYMLDPLDPDTDHDMIPDGEEIFGP